MSRFPAARASWSKPALGSLAAFAALSLWPGEAKAVLVYNIFQSGNNVVVNAAGSLSLGPEVQSPSTCGSNGEIIVGLAYICTGPDATKKQYGLTTVTNLFPSGGSTVANSVTGSSQFLLGAANRFYTNSASGAPIASSATFNNKTLLAIFGFTAPGLIGEWTLNGTGDSIYVCVGSASCVPVAPVPGPLPLFGAGAAFGWSRQLRRRIGAAAVKAAEV